MESQSKNELFHFQDTVNSRLLPALDYDPLLLTTRIFWPKLNILLSRNTPLSRTTLTRNCQKKLLPAGSKPDFTVHQSWQHCSWIKNMQAEANEPNDGECRQTHRDASTRQLNSS